MLLVLFLLPLAYLAVLVRLALRRDFGGIALSLAIGSATMVAGAWGILQSRGSTAGIGFIFLPMSAAAAAGLALWAARFMHQGGRHAPIVGWAGLVLALVPAAAFVVQGVGEGERNATRDAAQAERSGRIDQARDALGRMLDSLGPAAGDTLDRLIRARRADREFLMAALERDGVSASLLDTLASSPDLGIALHAVRNRGASAATLARVHRTSVPGEYFDHALARHPNTPPDILRSVRSGDPKHDIWFAENPALPRDMLQLIARSSASVHVVRVLLQRPSLDCALIADVASGPVVTAAADPGLAAQIAELRQAHRC